ncbi:pericentriolar material 1 protein-like isoform X2 [Ylistrum balloti]|uniref:pericentriolar material 1 protein-like isoform X2 n=1 Tax=Ylistrum balloti TaxID=509963 RepID=UPI002905A3F6|nr:pericentriolar material 1 protein-like isoform X2 [Ylistrum balloti]
MATGGNRQFMKSASTDPRPRKAWQRSTSASDKEDNISIHSIPNDLRPNNWDFSGWKPNPGIDNTKRRKKGNPEREREQSLSLDSPPPSERQQRTPSTFPRTRITPSTPTSQRVALEKLRQHMTFSDLEDGSNDGERNNERNVPTRRGKLENFTRQDTSSTSEGATAGRGSELQGEHGHIVSRLMQIREYIKQANTMKEALSKSGSPQNKEDYERVSKLVTSLEEQEKGYVAFMAQCLSVKEDSTAIDWSNQGQETPLVMESADEEACSVDLEVQSETSDATTQDNETSPLAWRPRIEDKLGLTDGDEEENDNVERTIGDGSPGPDMMDNTLTTNTDNHTRDWDYMHEDFEQEARMEVEELRKNEVKSLRQQQELLKKLVHQQEQMKALRGRQTELLALQQDAERKLADAKASERMRASSAPATNTSQNHMFMSANQKPVGQSVDNNPQTSRNTTDGLPGDLQEIRQHLNYLRNELKEQTPETAERQSNPELEAATNAAALEDNRRQLQDKLMDLQSKKQRMDTLLQELQNLRSQRFDAALNNMPQIEPEIPVAQTASAPNTSLLEESKAALNEAGNTETNAQEILDILDAQEKLRKLQEVKQRLNQLRSLVQYYQSETTEGGNQSDETTAAAFRAQLDMMEEMHNLGGMSGLTEGEAESPPSQPPQRKPYSMAPSAGVVAAAATQLKSDEDNRSEESRSSESESHLSSLGPWGDDPEIQEKVQKLKEAKEKLRQLQDLVSIVQQSPDGARGLPDNLAELAASLESDGQPPAESHDHLLSDGEVPMLQTERDSLEEAKNQLRELEALKDERRRLLTIQQELQALQGHFAGMPEKDEENKREVKTEIKEISDPAAEEDEEEVDDEDKENQRPLRLSAPVVKFSSNDEVYGKMRKQRMMREELRQKKRELEAIMKKDNGNKKHYSKNQDNQSDTVSYSTDMYGASMSADATMATWGGSTVDNLESITEDNDRLDREEEDDDAYPSDGIIQVEEEEEENDSDNNTYTIEEDVRQRREARTQRHVTTGPSRAQKRRTFPRARKDQKDGARPKQGSWSKKTKQGRVKQEELMQDDSPDGSKLMDSSASQYEALQLQLQRTASMCQTLMGADQSQALPGMGLLQTSAMPSPGFGYRGNAMPDMFQQQMQQQQMMMNMSQCLQQIAMQQMEIQNLQRHIQGFTPDEIRLRSLTSLSAAVDSRGLSPNIGALPRPDSFSQPPSSFLQRQSMDNLLSGQAIGEDNVFESERRLGDGLTQGQDARSRSLGRSASTQSTGSKQRAHTERLLSRRNESLQPRIEESIPSLPVSQARKKKKTSSHQRQWSQASSSKDGGAAQSDFTANTSDILNSLTQRVRSTGLRTGQMGERPGLSAGISGAGFGEEGSVASTLSNRPQRESLTVRKKESRDVDDSGDLTLFEALRESIYAEVATLISQNENRPHFLIELFRELQKLTSDYLRQRVLYSIKHLVSMFLTEQGAGPLTTGNDEPLPAWMNTAAGGTASELTPSESNLTTDDEEITMKLRDLTIDKRRALARGESLQNDQFDYVEAADYDSSLSTPSTSYWDNPFSQDLGDTVIHLDKALKKMRENESKLAAAEKAKLESKKQKPTLARPPHPVSEPTSSSAVDQGSESSVSSTSYSRIDTQELNKQIKMIMKEVIPVIKEHIDHVCSYELLAYIKRLVLSLTRQYDSSQYATFFHAQLSSALHDTLSKFEGRKLRMCGEDLLVDMSEVLFNELAFFRLMQGLGEKPGAVNQQVQSSGTQTKEEAEISLDEEDTQTQESDTTESTVTEDEDSEQDRSLRLNAAEEEELGKLRDDEFASEIQIQDADDKDDEIESPYKAVQIELAVSETKPFTRIGSDEDDEDADESQSADDPSETAVSRDAMMEKSHSLEDGDDLEMPEEETPVSDINEGDADQGANTVGDTAGDRDSEEGIRMNGEVLENGELIVDDLPDALNLAPMVDVQNKMTEEQKNNSSVEAVLSTIEVQEELAGDGQSLKEPGTPTYPPVSRQV